MRVSHKTCIAGLLYFFTAWAMIALTSSGRDIAAVWPANAILVALMLQSPKPHWRPILIVGLLANIMANLVTRGTLLGPFLFGAANMVEVFVAAWSLRAKIGDGMLRKPESVGRLLFWAGLVAPGASAPLGAVTAWLVLDAPFASTLATWFFADALGLLVFTPFFAALFKGEFVRCFSSKSWPGRGETLFLQGLVLATAVGVFQTDHLPVLFLLPIPILLVTFRAGWLGTKMSIMLVAVVVAVATINGSGPIGLTTLDPLGRAYFAQFYLAALLLTQLPIAASLASRADLIDQLARSQKSVHMLAEQSEILLISLNRFGMIVRVVGASRQLLDRDDTALVGKGLEALAEPLSEKLIDAFRDIVDIDGFDQTLIVPSPRDPNCWLQARFHVIEGEEPSDFEVALTIQDVTDRKRKESQLMEMAHVDAMTGLLNRAGFADAAQRAMTRARDGGLFLAMIDVDRFKLINDNLGHAAGDAVLVTIAKTMKDYLRSSDIIGRLGGDEFTIIFSNITEAQAHEACNRLVTSIAEAPAILPEGGQVTVNISCGVACWHTGMDLETLKSTADAALYEAKRNGRNRAVAA